MTASTTLIDLGHAVGRLELLAGDRAKWSKLCVMKPSGSDENCYYHAESVEIVGVKALLVLRDALNTALLTGQYEEDEKANLKAEVERLQEWQREVIRTIDAVREDIMGPSIMGAMDVCDEIERRLHPVCAGGSA